MKHHLEYLAAPYTHKDPVVVQKRVDAINNVAADLMNQGRFIFSPISHSHPLFMTGKMSGSWEFWRDYDIGMLARCCKLVVLRLDGWEQSVGVSAEIDFAKKYGIPIEFIDQ